MIEHRLQRFEHASPIGRWSVSVCTPDPRLADVVASMWYGEGQVAYQRDRILPSGQSQLLINLGPPQYRDRARAAGAARAVRRRLVLGAAPGTDRHRGAARQRVVRRRVLGARHVSLARAAVEDSPTASSRSRMRSVTACSPCASDCSTRRPGRAVRDRRALAARASEAAPGVHPAVRWAVDRIAATGGRVPVEGSRRRPATRANTSRHLFQHQVGLTPKSLCRIHRFRGALAMLDGATQVPWAALADQCGYYDQSHLINEFRRSAGSRRPSSCARPPGPAERRDPLRVVIR